MARKGYKIYERDIVKAILKKLNSLPGCWVKKRAAGMHNASEPDISGILMLNGVGVRVEIEVKVPGNKPTTKQAQRIEHWSNYGAIAGWADSTEGAMEIIEEYLSFHFDITSRDLMHHGRKTEE